MKKDRIKALLMISQIGISMIVPIFLAAFIGNWLDAKFGTGFFFLIFLLLGILAAFRNIYKLTKPFYAEDLKRERQEQAYWENLKKARSKQGGGEGKADGDESETCEANIAAIENGAVKPDAIRTAVKSRRERAEEEFDFWRREREKSHDGGNSHDSSENGG